MRVSTKILLALTVVMALHTLLDYGVHRFVVLPGYLAQEEAQARKDMVRCLEALGREIHHLDVFTNDWAAWDDTVRFVKDRNEAYVRSNLVDETFEDNRLNLIHLCDPRGRRIWSSCRDLENGEELELKDFSGAFMPASHPLLQRDRSHDSLAGVFMTEKGPMLLASRPVLSSSHQGPMHGRLVMGRFLGKRLREILCSQTRVDHRFESLAGDALSSFEKEVVQRLSGGDSMVVHSVDSGLLRVYSLFPDVQGRPALLVRADLPREVSMRGEAVVRMAFWSDLTVFTVLFLVLLVLLRRIVVHPLHRLTRSVTVAGDAGELPAGMSSDRTDEIGVLSREFDRMVGQLREVHRDLESRVEDRTRQLREINRKLQREVAAHLSARQALHEAREELERLVAERTHKLVAANRKLKEEIAQRRRAEEERLAYEERLRSLSSRLLLAEERERRRIATDLHDRIGQALAMSRIRLGMLGRKAADSHLAAEIGGVRELVEEIIQDTRQLTFELSPPILYELGLGAAVEWLAEQIQKSHPLRVHLREEGNLGRLKNGLRVTLFRAVRELLFNVVKHAEASMVEVALEEGDGKVDVVVEDDGRGFEASELQGGYGGFGLFSIRERLSQFEGVLQVDSRPGQGARVTLTVPLPPDDSGEQGEQGEDQASSGG